MLAYPARLRQMYKTMSEENKCPMGKHPWLATFLAVAFLLVFAAKQLGFL
ncbi:MAG: hypothetical protein H0T45_10605 [Pyrinomonadaceae bacterium]|nr:hypothetical protein [Pyrinomonadaceae bacterium]